MSQTVHHRYSVINDGCAYCRKKWSKLADPKGYCVTFEAAVDMVVDWAKQGVELDAKYALHRLGLGR